MDREIDSVSKVRFYPAIADSKDYPKAAWSMDPALKLGYMKKDAMAQKLSRFIGSGMYFNYGRYAIYQALCNENVTNNNVVLLPAYHCRSMVEPAIYCELDVHFYSLDNKLQVSLSEIKRAIASISKPVKVIVITHYFGFPQKQLYEIVEHCKSKSIKIIEDCAHAFYGKLNSKLLGSIGDYAIASPRKLLPVLDGGVLIDNSNSGEGHLQLSSMPLAMECKSILSMLLTHKYSRNIHKVEYGECLLENIDHSAYEYKHYEYGIKYFSTEFMGMSGSLFSQWIIRNISHTAVIKKRRQCYRWWLNETKNIDGLISLYDNLPDDVTPYVFPIVVEKNPIEVFHCLKMQGVPIQRWEDMAVVECSVARNYRVSLFQLPCHQDMTYEHVKWIADVLKGTINKLRMQILK